MADRSVRPLGRCGGDGGHGPVEHPAQLRSNKLLPSRKAGSGSAAPIAPVRGRIGALSQFEQKIDQRVRSPLISASICAARSR
jgi:hypothetical protein